MTWNYGDVPTWIEAGATVGAFIAAGFAATWTAKTARSARKQVAAAQEQVAVAREQVEQSGEATQGQLAAMRDQIELATKDAQAAEARFLRAQLDALAPTVYARAKWLRLTARSRDDHLASPKELFNQKYRVSTPLEIRPDEYYFFGMRISIDLVNCSGVPARIDFIETGGGEISGLPQGQEVILPPNERRELFWHCTLTSAELRTETQVNDPRNSFACIRYWLRDLGMSIQDTHAFNLDLRHFSIDGSRLLVQPKPASPWDEIFASQIPPRRYERLESERSDAPSG